MDPFFSPNFEICKKNYETQLDSIENVWESQFHFKYFIWICLFAKLILKLDIRIPTSPLEVSLQAAFFLGKIKNYILKKKSCHTW